MRVAVVDADLARQGLTTLLLNPQQLPGGLREALDGADLKALMRVIQPWPMAPTFDLLPAGASQASDRVILPGPLATVLGSLRANYEVVLIDTPPLLQVASASTIVSLVDGVLAVVPHGSSVALQRPCRADCDDGGAGARVRL